MHSLHILAIHLHILLEAVGVELIHIVDRQELLYVGYDNLLPTFSIGTPYWELPFVYVEFKGLAQALLMERVGAVQQRNLGNIYVLQADGTAQPSISLFYRFNIPHQTLPVVLLLELPGCQLTHLLLLSYLLLG